MENLFDKIISLDNLFESWKEFRRGKRKKFDVQFFERNLEDNLFELHEKLKSKNYKHSHYTSFYVTDPKRRHIHKAFVLDRIVHHAIYRVLYPMFDKGFIHDSYSCRLDKGTHKAVRRLEDFTRKVSRNYSKPCFALKCDVKKFFDSVDHEILFSIIKRRVSDPCALWLTEEIIWSYPRERERERETKASPSGIPIGNLTSQIFANIYLNEFDRYIKHKLKIRYYLRYCDDFVILDNDMSNLEKLIPVIANFLKSKLKLGLHPNKVEIRKLKQGIDFLGYIILPYHTVLRTKTKKRMLKRVNKNNLSSYLGLLRHCEGHKLVKKIEDLGL